MRTRVWVTPVREKRLVAPSAAASTSGGVQDRGDAGNRSLRSARDRDSREAERGLPFQGWLQEGLQCWDGRTAPSEQGELVAWLQRSCQALGEAASCYSASHHLTGAGVEGIDGQQQAGQASTAHA